ncbi:MAG: NAD(P)-dependent alcohol dehydrogenase [Acidimicrobiales bacterium]|jgi:L-iditol 2-dehydrogenase
MVNLTNKAAVLYGNFDLRIEDRPMPVPRPREVLVEVASVGVCGSDVHYYEHGRIGDFVVSAPLVLGHEASGTVVGRGELAHRHEIGARVALEPGVPCGSCRECRTGHYNLCRDVVFFATPPVDGALARYVTIHEDYAFWLPDHVSYDAGALCEPLSVGLWASRQAGITVGARVSVAGAGPIGAAVTLVALAAGATEVIVSDPVPERRARLLAVGATSVVDPTTSGLEHEAADADVFVDCSGSPAAIVDGIKSVRPAGAAVLVGMCPASEVPIPIAAVQTREIRLTGTFRYANTYPQAIALIASGAIDLEGLIDARFSLDSAEEALTAARRDPSILKPLVRVAAP